MIIKLPKDLYGMQLSVYIGNKELFEKHQKEFDIPTDYDGLCCIDGPNAYIYLDHYDTGTLIHELSHFAIGVFHRIDMEISITTEEAFAYYIENVYNNINSLYLRKQSGQKKPSRKTI